MWLPHLSLLLDCGLYCDLSELDTFFAVYAARHLPFHSPGSQPSFSCCHIHFEAELIDLDPSKASNF